MSGLDGFWEIIDAQLRHVRKAKSLDDVVAVLGRDPELAESRAVAFFGGSGGDEPLWGALREAGWHIEFNEFDYYFAAWPPGDDGPGLVYIEGDVYRLERGADPW